jgi:hypothetical protein
MVRDGWECYALPAASTSVGRWDGSAWRRESAWTGRILRSAVDERGSGSMKRVPAEEFARHAAEYLEGTETVSVEKDGEIIGRYVPVPNGHVSNGAGSDEDRRRKKAESRAAFARLRSVLQEVYKETGLTEDEFADLMDPSKPFPYDLDPES